MSNQLIPQWNYIMHFHIRGSFLTTFCTSFLKRVHNSKETVNLQVLFVSAVGYVHIKTYSLKKYYYIVERVHFIYRLFIYLSVHFHYRCFYIQYHGGRGEIASIPV